MNHEQERERSERRRQLSDKLRTIIGRRSTSAEDARAKLEHEALPWIYPQPTFRMLAETDVYRDANGNLVAMKLCESYEGGHWEPFYAVVHVAQDRSN